MELTCNRARRKNMKNVLVTCVLGALLSACGSAMVAQPPAAPPSWTPPANPSTTTIYLYKDKVVSGTTCVKKTRTQNRNCRKHKDNLSCNIPGDTIVWKWQQSSVTQTFKITPKPPFTTAPFESNASCTATASTVTCKIKTGTAGTFFDYNVIVDPSSTPILNCNLDPRFLIY